MKVVKSTLGCVLHPCKTHGLNIYVQNDEKASSPRVEPPLWGSASKHSNGLVLL